MNSNISYYTRDLSQTVALALAEDRAEADITAELIPADTRCEAFVISREAATVCGQAWVAETFRQVDPELDLSWHLQDGDRVEPNQEIFSVSGVARSILTAERTALNFLQTLSATATEAQRFSALISHTPATILDTRKTLPGLRQAQKYAVTCGGASNHRLDLNDAFLIKENHISACGSIADAIGKARLLYPEKRLEIEVESLAEFHEACQAQPDWIMLDNFSLEDLSTAVAGNHSNIKLEASGGIENDSDLITIAETGVDFVSIGAITKHCRAIDLSLQLR